MSVSLENLANLRDGSYYLSDNGEVKKGSVQINVGTKILYSI